MKEKSKMISQIAPTNLFTGTISLQLFQDKHKVK